MGDKSLLHDYLPRVEAYLREAPLDAAGDRIQADVTHCTVTPLAQGEYNLNYLVRSPARNYVLRVNIGTQIEREDQILYEYNALRLLEGSGVTPCPYFVDDSRTTLDRGVLLMEYLPGVGLDYTHDLSGAAATLATIHQHPVRGRENGLIVEDRPLSLIFDECSRLLKVYFDSELARPEICSLFEAILDRARTMQAQERYYADNPWNCIVNTEVNSGNFIVNEERKSVHLVDWEMPRWGDPSTDLCHFCSPLTTLWKTDYRFTPESYEFFLNEYRRHITDAALRDSLKERLALKFPFVYLRGIAWSAMGWVAYQTEFDGVRNEDTWKKLQLYMDRDLIRSLFAPLLDQVGSWRV
jgi:aminoglycoside phosphotransferase (APT) family kinase protein